MNEDCENKKEITEIPFVKQETALENLAKNLEKNGKYKDMPSDVKEMDMIAFKVLMPDFVKSDYAIGIIQAIIGKTTPEKEDYDLSVLIMGKNRIFFVLFLFNLRLKRLTKTVFIISAGSENIEHLIDQDDNDDGSMHIQINRMDIFDAKILFL